ncbi:glycosyltransferase family 2 protein [Alicyclobacillus acidoterrestris]|uniref:Glycosyltransferase family 2 protein n=1 Tax=Alicyclobacillus acidoterrestris (strain ATCC 49025 / DSM 3922 / CIP 106132 / NCIMB 13137 / GD3B) TaxID=1356854 RepID=T0DMY7_ALIAG|nr:glycosyltransferase family 2 protein [Alicyclobacillus acidoterrestris]EPZ52722.1 glycosyl transferase [Alicyclobacillus acidoterrestris ATCC 49025]UNO47620.1 glycosyltransferase family 2 protein [Alicyclobacillus acidoterrestris]
MRIAVLLPCYNEELTIGKVVADFRRELPDATIYVYDNNSKDRTAEIAREAGAIVRKEIRQGKGNVVRSMFRDIDADIYVMADGDDTYPAEFVHELIRPVLAEEADMVIGDRHSDGSYENENKRPFHNFGNHFVKGLINRLFHSGLRDIMTGYRVFNRRFAKTMPIKSEGFEIETEMTLHALDKRFRIVEIPITYRDRPPGSESKLNTFSDGLRVLKTVFWIFKDYKPLAFFSIIALILFILGLIVGIPVITEFLASGRIAKMPSAILAVGFMVLATNALTCGFILDTIVRNHRDQYELMQSGYRG